VTVFAVISFAMLMVLVGLIVDVGRIMNVHSQVNAYADRAALAAAAQLDGRTGALTRARDAARNAVAGFRFSLSGDTNINVQKLTFLSRLGPDPSDPFAASPRPGDTVVATWTANSGGGFFQPTGAASNANINRTAAFVVVDTNEQEQYIFLPFLTPGSTSQVTIAPQAVAGFHRNVCSSPPLMVCNPDEPSGGSSTPYNPQVGVTIPWEQHGDDNQVWRQDRYSVLRVPSTTPSNLRRYMREDKAACYADSVGVESFDFQTQRNAIRRGLNERYDDGDGDIRFPVAVINCRQHRNLLQASETDDDVEVPVGTWIRVEMRDEIDDDDDDNRIRLRILGPALKSNLPDDELREFPALNR
jgi:hypothetical protein